MPTLEWIGKNKVVNHHLNVPYCVLERKYSYGEDGQHEAVLTSDRKEYRLRGISGQIRRTRTR